MNRLRARYGASALHLALTLSSFALALYAGVRLLDGDTWGVAVWFVGAALLHDLVLLPLYSAGWTTSPRRRPCPRTCSSGAGC
ncbi:hypothetical protein ACFWP3_20725 [Streptomyces sp. NPDC058525]|uniref:hypothetical protein n=1 Tax=Streptomyces sp. NPDC058525 TaxID=3346538 RepID=UPI00364C2697